MEIQVGNYVLNQYGEATSTNPDYAAACQEVIAILLASNRKIRFVYIQTEIKDYEILSKVRALGYGY